MPVFSCCWITHLKPAMTGFIWPLKIEEIQMNTVKILQDRIRWNGTLNL